jgi:hypothetical protein
MGERSCCSGLEAQIVGFQRKNETDTNVCLTSCHSRIVLLLRDQFLVRAAKSSGAEGAALLEALAAKNRASLCGPEGDRGVLSALGAGGLCFRTHLGGAAASTAFSALGLAAFASFRFVLETFIGEKHLLAGGKNKLSAALRTL